MFLSVLSILCLIFTSILIRYKQKTKGSPDSQLVVIGSLSGALPWILRNARQPETTCVREAVDFVKCTHPVSALSPFVDMYSRLLHAVMNGRDLRQEIMAVLSHSELGGPQKRQLVLSLLDKAARWAQQGLMARSHNGLGECTDL